MTSTADEPRVRRPDFLVFSDDWGEHPSSCQHIFRHIAKDHRVLWVNTIGMRNPTLSWTDVRKVFVKVSKMFERTREPGVPGRDRNIKVCQPFMLPGSRSRAVRAFNARSVTRTVSGMMARLGMNDPIFVATVPNVSEYPELLNGRKVVYYCVDDFSLWPGLDADVVREMEARLIARADCLIAVSDTLFQRLSMSGKPVRLLTHGVDLEMFSTAAVSELPCLSDIPRPRVGFFGLIDGRMDWELLIPLAKRMPEVSFVFAGPVDASAGELPRLKNMHFVGRVAYRKLPEFVAGLESLMLPYRTGALAEALSPLKLKEYLATRKPIVMSPIGESRQWSGAMSIASTVEEWSDALRSGGRSGDPTERSRAAIDLSRDSWEQKSLEFQEMCA